MKEVTRVNFHCHSNFSDGSLAPDALAEALAATNVHYAALTDHNTIEGLPRFAQVLKRRGIGLISGVEISTQYARQEIHLLGYGFDINHPELRETLLSLRRIQEVNIHSIADSMRRVGTGGEISYNANNAAPNGTIELSDAIALIHRAGGKAFLAHPLLYFPHLPELEDFLVMLKENGLDGIEALYAPYSDEQQTQLADLAQRYSLLICSGTDFHNHTEGNKSSLYIDIPTDTWKAFRNALYHTTNSATIMEVEQHQAPANLNPADGQNEQRHHPFLRRYFVLRILVPTLLAITLFVAAIWGVILPSFEHTLLERKRELIRELTNSAWSILAAYERDERNGLLTREEAQDMAKTRIESLRYGREGKDYFWLQDMYPHIIVHPYRKDLNGQDVSDFTDARGVRIFVEFSELVRRSKEGYIEYVWQWKDDPQRLEAKESYIKGFEPWGWVIGTGIYIEDVKEEIARLEQNIIQTSAVISGVVILLLAFVVQQSLRVEQERQEGEESLFESTERYRSLVEATTEGTLLILEGHCRYANPKFLQMLGYNSRQLEMMDLADLLPKTEENSIAWERVSRLLEKIATAESFEGVLRRADGSTVDCLLAFNPISFSGYSGLILLARDLLPRYSAERQMEEHLLNLGQAAEHSPIGIFRAKANRRAKFLEMNNTANTLIQQTKLDGHPTLAHLFHDTNEFDDFFTHLQKESNVHQTLLHLETEDATTLTLSLSAILLRDEHGQPSYILGSIENITEKYKRETQKEALIERLQTSLLFLQEPVGHFQHHIIKCNLEMPAQKAAALMTSHRSSAALVETESGIVVGIITDHDLRKRVLAQNVEKHTPVRKIMSAPLITISENALVYEALMTMEEHGIQHIAVKDENDDIISILRYKDLIQFHRYGVSVLTQEINRTKTVDEIVQCCERMPTLIISLLNSGARPRYITHIISSICDAAVEKLIQLAIDAFGFPPAPFAFMALGSHGRMEQTLVTDQDNALIFLPPDEEHDPAQLLSYFLQLGDFVCGGLHKAGFTRCQGKVMANNPRWCQPLDQWKQYFKHWIQKAEPKELLEFSIFFDFRTVHGNIILEQELRKYIHELLFQQPQFFIQFAQNALLFSPPFRLFGKIYIGGGVKEQGNQLNLKETLLPIISFARLYTLKHNISQTQTLERLEALLEKNILYPSTVEEITNAYDYLMQLRLNNQAHAVQNGQTPDNIIHINKLGHIHEAQLKQAFIQISAVQKKINYDFLGGSG